MLAMVWSISRAAASQHAVSAGLLVVLTAICRAAASSSIVQYAFTSVGLPVSEALMALGRFGWRAGLFDRPFNRPLRRRLVDAGTGPVSPDGLLVRCVHQVSHQVPRILTMPVGCKITLAK